MRKSLLAGLGAVMVVVMLAFAYAEADAARIGGGRSFGGRPSMSQPFTRSLPSNPSSSFNRQAQRPGQQMANAASPAGRGLFGGMGGMLGGLLAGSLLGSLLFGGGFHGGGFLDIIIIGGSTSPTVSSPVAARPRRAPVMAMPRLLTPPLRPRRTTCSNARPRRRVCGGALTGTR